MHELLVSLVTLPVLPSLQTKLDTLQGADPEGLESRIRQHYGDGEGEEAEDSGVPGHVSVGRERVLNIAPVLQIY